MTQAKAVMETIEKLGGIATLNQINQHIFEIEDCVWKRNASGIPGRACVCGGGEDGALFVLG